MTGDINKMLGYSKNIYMIYLIDISVPFVVPYTKEQRKTFRKKASSCPDFKL